jgi:hypothetical protein
MISLAGAQSGTAGPLVNEDLRWLIVLAATTLAEIIWWAAARGAGLAPVPRLMTYLVLAFAGLTVAFLLRLATRRHTKPASLQSVIPGAVLIAIGGSFFLPLKFAIPGQVPFWLDASLAATERRIFGTDPWLLLDRFVGWALVPMDWLYVLWLPVQLLILFTVMLEPPSAAKSRALMAHGLAWFVLGVAAATLLSSAGPIFFDRLSGSSEFATLRGTLQARGAWVVFAESDAMWAAYANSRPGLLSGISALPSIHVAIALWIFLTARTMAPRLAKWALLYFVLMWLGSVQLGWHYVSDGLAGAIGMLLIWALASTINWAFEHSAKRSRATEIE